MIIIMISDKNNDNTTSFYFVNDSKIGNSGGLLHQLREISKSDEYPYLINYDIISKPVISTSVIDPYSNLAYFDIHNMLKKYNLHDSMIQQIVDECVDNEEYCECVLNAIEAIAPENRDAATKYTKVICDKVIEGLKHRMETVTRNFQKFHNANRLDNIEVYGEDC